jgi:hypothetical protein
MDSGNDPRYEIDNPEIRARLLQVGEMLSDKLPKNWGFTLFLFSYGDDRQLFYLSSANRQDMVRAVREWLQREGGH